jgi:hypothetical protein
MTRHRREDRANRLVQLDLGWVEERVRVIRFVGGGRDELEDVDAIQRPTVRLRRAPELLCRL